MEDKALAYFSGINPLAKRILEDCKKVEIEYSRDWEEWDFSKKEQILDDILIHAFVKDHYSDQARKRDQVYPESFPKLSVSSGEKIIVDFDNDCWTWQDEHSGPFSWKTKSQQDLSLADLEPGEITKVKSSKTNSSSLNTPKNGVQRIRDGPGKAGVSKRIWESPFHVVERKGDSGYPSSQDSIQSSFDDVRQSLELGSREESTFSIQTTSGDSDRSPVSKPAVLQISQRTSTNGLDRGVKSPTKSPIISRLPLSPSFNKKNKNDMDDTADELIDRSKRESVGQDNAAFMNLMDGESCEDLPVSNAGFSAGRAVRMTGEWSSFVGESSSDTLSSGISSPSRRPLIISQDVSQEPIAELEGTTNESAEAMTSDYLLPQEEESQNSSVVRSGFDFLDNW